MTSIVKILPVIILGGFIFLTSCEDDLPTRQDTREFAIESVTVSRNQETNMLHLQAHVIPGTESPVDSVWFQAYQPDSLDPFIEEKLYDDGTNGDMIPLNQRYSAEIPANFISPYLPPESDLEFRFIVYARDASQQTRSEEGIYRIQRNYPVRIDTVFLPDTVNAGNSEQVFIEAVVSDSNGIDDVRQVQIRQTRNNDQPDTSNFFQMDNQGNQGDRIPGDNIFSITFNTNPGNSVGPREMQLIASDNGNKKDTAFVQFFITND